MTQAAKIIDITRSFVPIDPRTYPETLHATAREDFPENRVPVVGYKGYNFLPTAQGYKSYFGVNASLEADALTSRVDKAFIIQTKTFENILITLCEDGIWTKQGDVAGAWTHAVTLTIPAEGSHLDWSYCQIGEDLFMYRAGEPTYWKLSGQPVLWEVDSYAAAITNVTTANGAYAGGLTAGTYSYRIASKNAQGAYSAPSAAVSVTVGADSYINIQWDKVGSPVAFRLYKILSSGAISYFDILANTAVGHNYIDLGAAGTTLASFPDATWEAVLHYAYEIITVTPTFLNMAGQVGIFAAGIRLGFWDTENSISWSSIDDFAEYTPSIETLAGSAIFSSIVGRIVNILAHGEGFLVYSTKSVVLIQQAVSATFQWDPTVLLNAGIAFPEQVCSGIPNTEQFAYTSIGFYKFDSGKAELIIPEITSYLKDMEEPVFLELLEGRYLFLQILDPNYIDGQIEEQVATVPPLTYEFPADLEISDLGDPLTVTGSEACYYYQGAESIHTQVGQAIIDAAAPGTYPPMGNGQFLRSYYTAYFSKNNAPSSFTWGPTPCPTVGPDGIEYNMCPVGNVGKVSNVSQDASNKWVIEEVPGDPLTRFDTEQFVAWQLAIWRLEEENREAFLQAILNRAAEAHGTPVVTSHVIDYHNGDSPETDITACPIPDPTSVDYCALGDYIAGASAPIWGMNACSFWLTRYITKKLTVQRVKRDVAQCEQVLSDKIWMGNTVDIARATATPRGYIENWINDGAFGGPTVARYLDTIPTGLERVQGRVTAMPGHVLSPDPTIQTLDHFQPAVRTVDPTMYAYNSGHYSEPGVYGVDTAYLQLKGWWYTSNTGAIVTIPANPTCVRPAAPASPPSSGGGGGGGNSPYGNIPIGSDGSLCGVPFTPITIDPDESGEITWEDTTITIPSGDFLLQEGSIGPIYPTFEGAFVYDLHLKKWGKLKHQYKRLLDYSPINNISDGVIPYATFGIHGGLIKSDGLVYLFDKFPDNSWLTYGKIGYSRLGFTALEELKINCAEEFQGTLKIQGSLDGKNLEVNTVKMEVFSGSNAAQINSSLSARWFDVTIAGYFDLTHLEFRGTMAGRR